jgi:RNA-directed DNA polymerase
MKCLIRRISDGKMLHLIKMWLKVPIEERDERGNRRMSGGKKSTRGTPQGGVISPLLANIYINRFLKAFRKHGLDERYGAVVVNYADDFVVLCRRGARQALEVIRRWMTRIGLELNETKTRVRDGRRESFDFLGYSFGPMYSPRTGGRYLGAAPSKKALHRLKEKIRHQLQPSNLIPTEQIVARLNRTVRGWANYFSYGTVVKVRAIVDLHVEATVRRFLRRRHKVKHRGIAQFPRTRIFGEIGVVSTLSLPRQRVANALS